MNVVLEGPDNSGKSTLADIILKALPLQTTHSGGPEKYPGEINDRIRKYLQRDGLLYDRHPCVSQEIYRQINGKTAVDPELIAAFYESKPLLIYCRAAPERGMIGHTTEDHDNPEHLRQVTENFGRIVRLYDEWAVQHAHVIYRIGDHYRPIIQFVRERYHFNG